MGNTVVGVCGQLLMWPGSVVLLADGHKKARCLGGLLLGAV